MKKNRVFIPSSVLPSGSKRITNAAGERVWLINGQEFESKRAYFQYLKDKSLAEKTNDEVNNKLREALQALFDECVIADMLGELSEAVTGETLDKVREALEAAKQSMHTDEGKAEAQEAKPNQLDTGEGLNW